MKLKKLVAITISSLMLLAASAFRTAEEKDGFESPEETFEETTDNESDDVIDEEFSDDLNDIDVSNWEVEFIDDMDRSEVVFFDAKAIDNNASESIETLIDDIEYIESSEDITEETDIESIEEIDHDFSYDITKESAEEKAEEEIITESTVQDEKSSEEFTDPITDESMETIPYEETSEETVIQEIITEDAVSVYEKINKYNFESSAYSDCDCIQYLSSDYDVKCCPDPDSEILISMKKGEEIKIVGVPMEGPWLKVQVGEQIGYVNAMIPICDPVDMSADYGQVMSDLEAEELWATSF